MYMKRTREGPSGTADGRQKRQRTNTRNTGFRRRRNYRYRSRPGSVITLVNRGPAIVPDIYMCKVKFTERRALTCTTGASNYEVYRLNSLYDPRYTVGGGQPAGFDQLSALYDSYRVLAASYSVTFTTAGSGAGPNNIECAIAPSPDPFAGTETPEQTKMLPRGLFTISYPGDTQSLAGYIGNHELLGMNKQSYKGDSETGALNTANPTKATYLNICFQPVDESSSASVFIYTTIVYYSMFYNRINLFDA